jgi:hypothetical protein
MRKRILIDALPKTPTAKVEKHVLRSLGLTPDCWDRERASQQPPEQAPEQAQETSS